METKFVLHGTTQNLQVQVFGTATGKPFKSEAAAKRKMAKMEKKYRHVDWMVLEISASPQT